MTPLLVAMRPRQWVKNLLVLAVPVAAGRLGDSEVLTRSLVALACFVAVSAAVYLTNDVIDVKEDRQHPSKSLRPIAAGRLMPSVAVAVAVALFALGVATPFFVGIPALGWVVVGYLGVQVAYLAGLKRVALVDVVLVSAGFVLRAVAGGAAAGLPVSPWFLTVTASGALFVVTAKRYSEMVSVGAGAGTRRSLDGYTESFLRTTWTVALVASVVFYALWAAEIADPSGDWSALATTVPFALVMLRYAQHADRAAGEAPEDVVLRDRLLQLFGLAWIVLFAVRW